MSENFVKEWFIDKDFNGLRIDYWLKKKFSTLSYPSLCKIIRKGQLRVNKKRVKNSYLLNVGDQVKLYKIINVKKRIQKIHSSYSESIKSWIIFKDKNLIALNKPSGIAVQGGSKITINIDSLLECVKYDFDERPKLVHRIDKKTSGLLIIARTLKSAKFMGSVFKNRNITKKYLLLVKGNLIKSKGEINTPILIDDKKVSAVTNFEILKSTNVLSLIVATPITGRKHQIRYHFNSIGYPIVGDDKFGDKDNKNFYLHSFYVNFYNEENQLIELFADPPTFFKDQIKLMKISMTKIKNSIRKINDKNKN
tara:strand:- start:1255 stop:2181 length:927 start_codon:yes stop_codon:yes gene_type:complete